MSEAAVLHVLSCFWFVNDVDLVAYMGAVLLPLCSGIGSVHPRCAVGCALYLPYMPIVSQRLFLFLLACLICVVGLCLCCAKVSHFRKKLVFVGSGMHKSAHPYCI